MFYVGHVCVLLIANLSLFLGGKLSGAASIEQESNGAFMVPVTYYGSGGLSLLNGMKLSVIFAESIQYADTFTVNKTRYANMSDLANSLKSFPDSLTEKVWLEFWTDTHHFADSIPLPDSFDIVTPIPESMPEDTLIEVTWNRSRRSTKYEVWISASVAADEFDSSSVRFITVETTDTTFAWRIPKYGKPMFVDIEISGLLGPYEWPEAGSNQALGDFSGLIESRYTAVPIYFQTKPKD